MPQETDERRRRRPNVLLIMTDQHRADVLGCMGDPIVQTPNLDRLAAGGTLFENAFTQCPVCMAARAAIHTGRYPRTIKVPSMGLLPPAETTLAETLKRAGYSTGMFGKLHFTPQEYTLRDLREDRPIFDAEVFLEPAGIRTDANLAAVRDPFKRNYGFDVSVGVEDFLWGHYQDWLSGISPEHLRRHAAENWGRPIDGVRFGDAPPATPLHPDHMSDLFDSRLPAELHPSRFIADRTLEFIRDHRDRPFFAHCSFVDPHHPFNAPAPYASMYPAGDMSVPDSSGREAFLPRNLPPATTAIIRRMAAFPPELWQGCLASYYGMITHVDSCIGRLLDGLAALGLAEDTLVVFTADHGEYMGDHGLLYKGSLLFDSVIRVPLIWRLGGEISAGRRSRGLVQTIDVFPTIMGLLGLSCHPGVQGRDLSSILRGGGEEDCGRIYCELDQLPVSRDAIPSQALRSRRWKIDYFPLHRTGALYDLVEDPEERYNLYGDARFAETRHGLMADLLDHLYRIKDPLPIRLSQA